MPTFEPGDVVAVPFPYVDVPLRERRPALVISASELGPDGLLVWVLMITSAGNASWPGDVAIEESTATGLRAPSVIRTAKIAVIESASARRVGHVGDETMRDVEFALRRALGLG